ncbi:hypothetical protein SAMN06295888_12350 [Desulfonatronum zhilinae]|nr:hypothetical protein SAMN06295888_12350 [Desulfonatronum zhilinae]
MASQLIVICLIIIVAAVFLLLFRGKQLATAKRLPQLLPRPNRQIIRNHLPIEIINPSIPITKLDEIDDLFDGARNGQLPDRFDSWDRAAKDGKTVAHVAAEYGGLPADFDRWELADEDGKTVAHVAAEHGGLPADFDRWELADKNGRTVAHEAAFWGKLPGDFDKWELADKQGETVAHEAASRGNLPISFSNWEWADERGRTVAHQAARGTFGGNLPDGFDRWELADNEGWTVAHMAAIEGNLPDSFNNWELVDVHGNTVAHIAAGRQDFGYFAQGLPENFDWERYGILANNEGRTVAHEAAEHGHLPLDFDFGRFGNLADNKGRTVRHVAVKCGPTHEYLFENWHDEGNNGYTIDQEITDLGKISRDEDTVTVKRSRLVSALKSLPDYMIQEIEKSKTYGEMLRKRSDLLWYLLLQSASTQGNSRGWLLLMRDQDNLNSVSYSELSKLSPVDREKRILEALRKAKVRMQTKKATQLAENFTIIENMGGVENVTKSMLRLKGMDEKFNFVTQFKGIGSKYGRNIWMDIYDQDFRKSIAIDERLKKIAKAIGVYNHNNLELFFIDVAKEANMEPWELDRLLYQNSDYFLQMINDGL